MTTNSGHTLVMTLAEMLAGKGVSSSTITECLQLLCWEFSFDCGLVYEINQFDHFTAKEQFVPNGTKVRESFSVDAVTSDFLYDMAVQTFCHIDTAESDQPAEQGALALLDIFSAVSLDIYPISDEDMQTHGLIVLLNTTEKEPLENDRRKILSTLLSMLEKYTAVRMYQKKLMLARASLEGILDNTGIDIYVNDFFTHDVLYVNKSMAKPYGGPEKFAGRKCWEVLFPGKDGPCDFCPQKKLIDDEENPITVYTWDYQRPFDGSWFRVFSAAFRWVDGRLAHVVSSADITDSKRNEELIKYMANYDPLTSLPNRRKLIHDCAQQIDEAQGDGRGYLLFFDIDGFKAINDTRGHDAGDEFLVQLGDFFSNIPMLKNSIYRNGGDEFVAVIGAPGVTRDHIRDLASFIHHRFSKPWNLKKGAVHCNTSIGVACYPEDGITAEELLLKSDQAMYRIKKDGGGKLCFFDELE